MKKFGSLLWGLVFIAVGIIVGLNSFKVTNIDLFFNGWWTLFIIVPCFIGLFTDNDKTGDTVGIAVGVILLLCCQDILNFDILWKLLLPIILIIIGLSFIFKETLNRDLSKKIGELNKNKKDDKEINAIFSSKDLNYDNEKVNSLDLNAVFGGVKCDLRNAKLDKEVVINTCSVFGGIDIYVKEDTKVLIKSTSLFGGVENKKKTEVNDKSKTIYINAFCMFGGVDIK